MMAWELAAPEAQISGLEWLLASETSVAWKDCSLKG